MHGKPKNIRLSMSRVKQYLVRLEKCDRTVVLVEDFNKVFLRLCKAETLLEQAKDDDYPTIEEYECWHSKAIRYFDEADAYKQPRLFKDEPAKPAQEMLL